MTAAGKHLILLIPGLEGPVSDHPIADYIDDRPASLDRLLSRAQPAAAPGHDPDSLVLQCFGLDATTPVAPLTYCADTRRVPPDYIMRADPVHLRADQHCLRLFESHSFAIGQDEADALVTSFNDFYAGHGWRLAAPVASRWYLESGGPLPIATTPPAAVAGRDINPSLPHGESAREWHAMLNEVQMLFHAHDVNLERERRGLPVINSLWPWGGGRMPGQVATGVDRVRARDPLAVALGGLAGIEVGEMPAGVDALTDLAGQGTTLMVQDDLNWPARYNEVEKWLETLQGLEQMLFAPLVDALTAGRIASLQLMPCNGQCFTVTRRGLRGFWRRSRPFEQVLA